VTNSQPPASPPATAILGSAPQWGTALCGSAVATHALAGAWDPVPLVHASGWLVCGLLLLPLLFCGVLLLVAGLLTALLGLLSLPWRLAGRPTGLGALVAALFALPAGILPAYLRALQRVRRPWLWGSLAGFLLGVLAYTVGHGYRALA
jgi:hypothetical protein